MRRLAVYAWTASVCIDWLCVRVCVKDICEDVRTLILYVEGLLRMQYQSSEIAQIFFKCFLSSFLHDEMSRNRIYNIVNILQLSQSFPFIHDQVHVILCVRIVCAYVYTYIYTYIYNVVRYIHICPKMHVMKYTHANIMNTPYMCNIEHASDLNICL
jgi:hypothetical protein